MADDKTLVTELGTALGIRRHPLRFLSVLPRPVELSGVSDTDWERFCAAAASGRYDAELSAAHANGVFFAHHPDGLGGRRPRLIEWAGGRRQVGDETVPTDLKIDHVYLVSCKYLSSDIQNPSPARLFERLLDPSPTDGRDWYAHIAPDEYQAFYAACVAAVGLSSDLPAAAIDMSKADRTRLRDALPRGRSPYPDTARVAHQAFCSAVSQRSCDVWRTALGTSRSAHEALFWRLVRVGPAPYFVLGTDAKQSQRIRVDTPWDWRQHFEFDKLRLSPSLAGQPKIEWHATYRHVGDASRSRHDVRGHVEIRWSHGRFAAKPEAKVYLDCDLHEIPGYNVLA